MIKHRTLLVTAGAGATGGAVVGTPARADTTVTISPAADHGMWEGWGIRWRVVDLSADWAAIHLTFDMSGSVR
ncbi:hypothetical protein [Plantactinospora sonchi]|uniref:Uncharacterized protein n=1 Tax=Plantactinospora sonchi TaxID=1544735 RepID=A0ABU7S0Q3_9ACTN